MSLKAIGIMLLLFCGIGVLNSQNINTSYGKNRIQYHDFEWKEYESEHFYTHWYKGGRELGSFSANYAEESYKDISEIIQYQIQPKISILIYNDLSDLKQTNIGNEESFTNNGGVTKVVGNKIFVYFNGSYQHLEQQISEGIAQVLIKNMMFGSNFKEIVQNAVLLDFPTWFIDGLCKHLSEGWTNANDNLLRDGILTGEFESFNDIIYRDPLLAGTALWNYIINTSGKNAISNILYISRIDRNVNHGLLYVTSKNLPQTSAAMMNYYAGWYNSDLDATISSTKALTTFKLNKKERTNLQSITPNPSNNTVALSTNELGKIAVNIADLASGQRKQVLSVGFKNHHQLTDNTYPLTAWSPNGQDLAIAYENGNKNTLAIYNTTTTGTYKIDIPNIYQRWIDFSYIDNNNLLVTCIINGKTAIQKFNILTRMSTTLKTNAGDYNEAVYHKANKSVVYTIEDKASTNLLYGSIKDNTDTIKLTDYKDNSIHSLSLIDDVLYYISDHTGINQVYQLQLDTIGITPKPKQVTNFTFSTNEIAYIPASKQFGLLLNKSNKNHLLLSPLNDSINYSPYYSSNHSNKNYIAPVKETKTTVFDIKPDSTTTLSGKDTVQFIVGYPTSRTATLKDTIPTNEVVTNKIDTTAIAATPKVGLTPSKIRQYKTRFRTNYIGTQLDNSPLIDDYIGYHDNTFLNVNPVSLKLSTNVVDLFEDYRIEAGVRVPLNLFGTDYYVIVEDLKHRIDKKYAFYRQKRIEQNTPDFNQVSRTKRISTVAEFQLKYPFNIYSSLRLKTFVRRDETTPKLIEQNTLDLPGTLEDRVGGKFSYVFDNSRPQKTNINFGSKIKAFYEVQQQLGSDINNLSLSPKSGKLVNIVGLDARHFIPVLKHSVWANRLSSATSFGPQKMVYFMGGVENEWFSSFDNFLEVNGTTESIAFATYAPQMRGFDVNSRNGNSFALINSELRIPVAHYFTKNAIKSTFMRDFQLVGFFDAGAAWDGINPFREDNPLNTKTVTNQQTGVDVTVNFFKQPLIYSYGAGIRSSLFGYFFKFDVAMGVDSKITKSPKIHFSVGTDF